MQLTISRELRLKMLLTDYADYGYEFFSRRER